MSVIFSTEFDSSRCTPLACLQSQMRRVKPKADRTSEASIPGFVCVLCVLMKSHVKNLSEKSFKLDSLAQFSYSIPKNSIYC